MIDTTGIYGVVLDYCVTFFLMGSALALFFYLALQGRLGFDEEAKYQLFDSDTEKKHDTRR